MSHGQAGIWSLADQGTVSLGNFLTNILLARALAPSDYGVFALAYGMLILMNSYHSSAVVYPLSLSGAPSTIEELHEQLRRSICLTLILAVPLGLMLLGAALILRRPEIAALLIFALLCWQVQETLRRGLMAHLRHAEAFWGDTLSYLGQAMAIWLYLRTGHRSLAVVFGILGSTSLLAGALQVQQLRLHLRWEKGLSNYVKSSWRVSRWAVLANTALAVPGVAYPWFLTLNGTYLAASYQALLNIVGVSNPVMMSVGNFVLPATVRANASGGWARAGRVVLRYGMCGAVLLLPLYAVIFVWPNIFLHVLYGSASPYAGQQNSLRLLAAAFCITYIAYLLGVFFYGIGATKTIFKAQVTGAALAIIFGLPLIITQGVSGACFGLILAYFSQTTVLLYAANSLRRNRSFLIEITPKSAGVDKDLGLPVMEQPVPIRVRKGIGLGEHQQ